MKNLLLISVLCFLNSCGSESDKKPEAVELSSAPITPPLTPHQAQIAKIEYPNCDAIWTGKKLSKCGERSFRRSLVECQIIGTSEMEGAPALLDEYAGDSWQLRAGRNAIRSIDDRVKYMSPDVTSPYYEGFAYALGNGTDSIRQVTCVINSKLRLESVS